MQDINLALRETLKTFMNSVEFSEVIKGRWALHRKQADEANAIQSEEKELDLVTKKTTTKIPNHICFT